MYQSRRRRRNQQPVVSTYNNKKAGIYAHSLMHLMLFIAMIIVMLFFYQKREDENVISRLVNTTIDQQKLISVIENSNILTKNEVEQIKKFVTNNTYSGPEVTKGISKNIRNVDIEDIKRIVNEEVIASLNTDFQSKQSDVVVDIKADDKINSPYLKDLTADFDKRIVFQFDSDSDLVQGRKQFKTKLNGDSAVASLAPKIDINQRINSRKGKPQSLADFKKKAKKKKLTPEQIKQRKQAQKQLAVSKAALDALKNLYNNKNKNSQLAGKEADKNRTTSTAKSTLASGTSPSSSRLREISSSRLGAVAPQQNPKIGPATNRGGVSSNRLQNQQQAPSRLETPRTSRIADAIRQSQPANRGSAAQSRLAQVQPRNQTGRLSDSINSSAAKGLNQTNPVSANSRLNDNIPVAVAKGQNQTNPQSTNANLGGRLGKSTNKAGNNNKGKTQIANPQANSNSNNTKGKNNNTNTAASDKQTAGKQPAPKNPAPVSSRIASSQPITNTAGANNKANPSNTEQINKTNRTPGKRQANATRGVNTTQRTPNIRNTPITNELAKNASKTNRLPASSIRGVDTKGTGNSNKTIQPSSDLNRSRLSKLESKNPVVASASTPAIGNTSNNTYQRPNSFSRPNATTSGKPVTSRLNPTNPVSQRVVTNNRGTSRLPANTSIRSAGISTSRNIPSNSNVIRGGSNISGVNNAIITRQPLTGAETKHNPNNIPTRNYGNNRNFSGLKNINPVGNNVQTISNKIDKPTKDEVISNPKDLRNSRRAPSTASATYDPTKKRFSAKSLAEAKNKQGKNKVGDKKLASLSPYVVRGFQDGDKDLKKAAEESIVVNNQNTIDPTAVKAKPKKSTQTAKSSEPKYASKYEKKYVEGKEPKPDEPSLVSKILKNSPLAFLLPESSGKSIKGKKPGFFEVVKSLFGYTPTPEPKSGGVYVYDYDNLPSGLGKDSFYSDTPNNKAIATNTLGDKVLSKLKNPTNYITSLATLTDGKIPSVTSYNPKGIVDTSKKTVVLAKNNSSKPNKSKAKNSKVKKNSATKNSTVKSNKTNNNKTNNNKTNNNKTKASKTKTPKTKIAKNNKNGKNTNNKEIAKPVDSNILVPSSQNNNTNNLLAAAPTTYVTNDVLSGDQKRVRLAAIKLPVKPKKAAPKSSNVSLTDLRSELKKEAGLTGKSFNDFINAQIKPNVKTGNIERKSKLLEAKLKELESRAKNTNKLNPETKKLVKEVQKLRKEVGTGALCN